MRVTENKKSEERFSSIRRRFVLKWDLHRYKRSKNDQHQENDPSKGKKYEYDQCDARVSAWK